MKNNKTYKIGMFYAISCAILWGFLPIYWKSLIPISSTVIIFYRIVLVGFITLAICLKSYGVKGIIEPLKQKGAILKYTLAGLLITINWSLYIWAVNSGQVLQTCIGYYIEPLFVCLLGVIVFKEKMTKYKKIALLFALGGVVIILLHFMQIPIIALSLAITFAVYAALKKSFKETPAILSLFYETMLLIIPALILIVYFEVKGLGAIAVAQPYQLVLLACAGILTAIPLLFFAAAAKRIPLLSLGMTEYISPSIALTLGIFVFKEPFDIVQFLSFVIIWIGLAVFSYGDYVEGKELKIKCVHSL